MPHPFHSTIENFQVKTRRYPTLLWIYKKTTWLFCCLHHQNNISGQVTQPEFILNHFFTKELRLCFSIKFTYLTRRKLFSCLFIYCLLQNSIFRLQLLTVEMQVNLYMTKVNISMCFMNHGGYNSKNISDKIVGSSVITSFSDNS